MTIESNYFDGVGSNALNEILAVISVQLVAIGLGVRIDPENICV